MTKHSYLDSLQLSWNSFPMLSPGKYHQVLLWARQFIESWGCQDAESTSLQYLLLFIVHQQLLCIHCFLSVCPHFQYMLARHSVFSPHVFCQHWPCSCFHVICLVFHLRYSILCCWLDQWNLLMNKLKEDSWSHNLDSPFFCHILANDSLSKCQMCHLFLEVWTILYGFMVQ